MAYEIAGLLFGMFNGTKISMVRRNVGYFPLKYYLFNKDPYDGL